MQESIRVPTKTGSWTGLVSVAAALCLLAADAAAGDADKARQIAATVCVACHGADGNSSIPNFPKLAGQQPEYLVRQLNAFISGRRPSDVMVPIVTALDPADFRPLAVYFGAQKATSEAVQDGHAAERGRKLYLDGDEERGLPACAGCHQSDARGNKRFPRLAGQHREYLIAEMTNFRKDGRSDGIGRAMREVARLLKDDEVRALAEFLATF